MAVGVISRERAERIGTARRIVFFAPGEPLTQGSGRAISHRTTGRAVLIADRRGDLLSWRFVVASAARAAGAVRLAGPLRLDVEFLLPAPAGRKTSTPAQRAKWLHPWRKPDLSKLIRSVEDALTGTAYDDDAQIVAMQVGKRYAGPDEPVGALIEIEEMPT